MYTGLHAWATKWQVEHQRCSRTGRVEKNHNILRKYPIYNEHPVFYSYIVSTLNLSSDFAIDNVLTHEKMLNLPIGQYFPKGVEQVKQASIIVVPIGPTMHYCEECFANFREQIERKFLSSSSIMEENINSAICVFIYAYHVLLLFLLND